MQNVVESFFIFVERQKKSDTTADQTFGWMDGIAVELRATDRDNKHPNDHKAKANNNHTHITHNAGCSRVCSIVFTSLRIQLILHATRKHRLNDIERMENKEHSTHQRVKLWQKEIK